MNKIIIILILIILSFGIYWLSLPEDSIWLYYIGNGEYWSTEISYHSQRFIKVKRWIVDKILVTEVTQIPPINIIK